ncbi:ribonuclease H-like domain-containing protein [Tanacetum coccineum]
MQKAKKNMRKINFKKAVAQKFREYDQKLEALRNFNVSEVFEKVVQAKVWTEMKKLLPTHILKAVANYVRPHLNTSVLEDPPNNREGENKKKRRKDVGEPSSRSSRQNMSPVVMVQDGTPAMQPLDKADILIQKHSNPEWFPKKSGLAKRRTDNPQRALKNKRIVDSGCSRHMTGNKAYLAEYQDYNGGPVAFGGSKGYITGKGKIKTGKLDFEDVCFVKELQHFNLFFVSHMCDKKNKVLFTDTECLVLSSNFKLPDENQVIILNTIDHLGKFEGKSDEGFLVGYSLQSKAFRPVRSENQANKTAGPKEANHSGHFSHLSVLMP